MFKIIFWRYHRHLAEEEAMPYSPKQKSDTREKILESARRLSTAMANPAYPSRRLRRCCCVGCFGLAIRFCTHPRISEYPRLECCPAAPNYNDPVRRRLF